MITSSLLNESHYHDINSINGSSEYSNKVLEKYLDQKPNSVLDGVDAQPAVRETKNIMRDPLTMIDIMLTGYIKSRMNKADSIAAEISEKSKAVAEINRLWGKVMSINLNKVDPADSKKVTDIMDFSNKEMDEINHLIINVLGEPKGIAVILPSSSHGVIFTFVNYEQLQSINATVTAFSDTIQVDLDSSQHEFKNLMTAITSAQEEIRDLRRIVISFTDR
ncbi:hypothetical protein [Providencia sneebia]|uniref:Uncharacterized protein n=1 Tax=Providencia sneebia DSM 19967 TaxID=1141660 RepID=K8WHN0_9GAMM|nr:hypothetical protein [Providencia sneebia]EKT60088.1 hypothetical protein OO7_04654 [Providencia sneebia DSM 19967]